MWVRCLVGGAMITTLVIAMLVPMLLLQVDPNGRFDHDSLRYGLGVVAGLMIAIAYVSRSSVAVAARVAILLPLVHLVVMGAAWMGWTVLWPSLPHAHEQVPLVDAIPISVVVAVLAAVIAIAARLIARRGRREVVHVVVMIALVEVLLLGLWLPIASHLVLPSGLAEQWNAGSRMLASPACMLTVALVPPTACAILYAAIVTRRARWATRLRPFVVTWLFVMLVAGIGIRMRASAMELMVYLNLLPWLLATTLVAVAANVQLSLSGLISARRHRFLVSRAARQYTGVIVGAEDEIVGSVEIRSWLRGPEVMVHGFEIDTVHGAIPVPPGAILAAPLPLATSVLRRGEGSVLLRGGAIVGLSGLSTPAGGAPFRGTIAPIADGAEIVVGPEDDLPSGLASGLGQAALAAWRPCVAYLVIFVIAALPALAGLIAA